MQTISPTSVAIVRGQNLAKYDVLNDSSAPNRQGLPLLH